MRKHLVWFGAGLAILGVIAFVLWSLFEIVPVDTYIDPSREARINEYLALDRWLAGAGRPVRVKDYGNLEALKAASEGTIVIQSALFDWTGEAAEYLLAWIEKGGSLILCLDYSWEWDEDEIQGMFLSNLGFKRGEWPDDLSYYYDAAEPSYGGSIILAPPEDESALALRDYNGLVRLVRLSRGRGNVTVTGEPRFMTSGALRKEQNARLSWRLLAGSPEPEGFSPGIFFIRGRERIQGLVGRLFQRGNFSALIVSGLALLVIGLWSVIPVFGILKGDDERPGRLLNERFLAEGRFLKRYGALESYRAVYAHEIRRRLAKKEGLRGENEMLRSASDIWAGASGRRDAATVLEALSPGRLGNRDFVKSIGILKTILERL
ncbi:MAG: DUF4350 domain-containing protein [Treponema sp.]|nr:DUF4350 domain-containing protein [Treponema sp.]